MLRRHELQRQNMHNRTSYPEARLATHPWASGCYQTDPPSTDRIDTGAK
jgi:hypothetical protein